MKLIFPLLMIFVIASCKKTDGITDGPGPISNPAVADSLINASYGTDARQKMDIYLPANRSTANTKVLFLVHGGGWTEGDKADLTASVNAIRASLPDYAFVNINYRLAANGQNLFPTQETDMKAALDFIYAKRTEYNISDKWALLGASAGAHLVLLQGYKYNSPVKVKAIVSFFGPTELTSLFNSGFVAASILLNVTGTTPAANASLYQQSSPVSFVNAQSPPTMLLQGGVDPLVPFSQATLLRDKLQSAGVANQYVFYPAEGHGWGGTNLYDSYAKLVLFLQLYVK